MYLRDTKEEASYTIKEDGVTKRFYIHKVENGYICQIEKEWTEGEGEKKEWKEECKTFISKEDPMILLKDTDLGDKISNTKALVESASKFF